MKAFPIVRLMVGLLLICLINACSDDTRVTLHEAHVYKGNIDVHKGDAQAREKRLQQRALLVFSDR
jgi:hypothetical protein